MSCPLLHAAAGIYKRALQQAPLLMRNPQAVPNKQAGCAAFIKGLTLSTMSISSLITSGVEVEVEVEVAVVVAVAVEVDRGLAIG